MAQLFKSDYVQYLCACGLAKPLCKVYFCRHCLSLKCGDCVFHEVDTHYCPNCMENMPPSEAKSRKNRCVKCFQCPCCQHTLVTRATTIQVPSLEEPTKLIPKKMYYLACGFCRWTSRDSGMPDQLTASANNWGEYDNPDAQRISTLLEHFRSWAQYEKAEKEQKKQIKRRSNYLSFSADKYSLPALARKRTAVTLNSSLSLNKRELPKVAAVEPAEATEDFEELDPDFFTQALSLETVATIDQRLFQPELQHTKNMLPVHNQLLIRRSQRCRSCEHNLSKPEYNSNSTKFKIHLGGFYHVPEVMIFKIPPYIEGQPWELQIRLCNRSQFPTQVKLLQLMSIPDLIETIAARIESEKAKESKIDPLTIWQETWQSIQKTTFHGEIQLPNEAIQLPARDDLAEYEMHSVVSLKEDPKAVVWRKGNKVVLSTPVTVSPKEGEKAGGLISVGLLLQYSTTKAGFETRDSPPAPIDVYVPVFLHIQN